MGRQIKRYERDAKIWKEEPENIIVLVGTNIYLDKSEVVYDQKDFTEEILKRDFDIKTGEWYVEDGWVVGKNPESNPGMIVSKEDYLGDVMMEVTAKMVEPSTHDINLMLHGEWHDDTNKRGNAYVTGLEAFWHGHIGFEKSPEYKLVVAAGKKDFDPEKEYRIRFGNVGPIIFTYIDGDLGLLVRDPNPLDINKYGKIGFEAFASWWKFKDLKVYKLESEYVGEKYHSEF